MPFPVDHIGLFSGLPRQRGQALVESLVALLALAVLWVALSWLAHYQDAALAATHASRYVAFVAGRGEQLGTYQALYATRQAFPYRGGESVVVSSEVPDASVSISRQRLTPLSVSAQPGAGSVTATTLRNDWSLADKGIVRARVSLSFGDPSLGVGASQDASLFKLRAFDLAYPPLSRSISILTGAGHGVSDGEVQSRVAASSIAWAAAYGASRAAGSEVTMRADGVERGWGRSAPDFDWLQPWSGQVPGHLLADFAANGGN